MAVKYTIIERDGSKVPFDVAKIRRAIMWATWDLRVNSLELESKFHLNLKDNTTTEETSTDTYKLCSEFD